jgi:hypothetical protein
MHLNDEVGLSQMAREKRKWDLPRRDGGMRPDGFEEYPKMLYRAVEEQGRIVVDDHRQCREIAVSREHEERLVRDGWTHSVSEARDAAARQQEVIATAAAERETAERSMSEPARREAAAVDAASDTHVPEIPEAPRRRGRPRKVIE